MLFLLTIKRLNTCHYIEIGYNMKLIHQFFFNEIFHTNEQVYHAKKEIVF